MEVSYQFYTFADLKSEVLDGFKDDEGILSSGLGLYKDALLANPYVINDNEYAMCLAITDGTIVGRYMLFPTLLKVDGTIKTIQTGGGIIVDERRRGERIGMTLIQKASSNDSHDLYFGALYTRAAYNIFKKTDPMLEIPQFVKERVQGIKKLLELPLTWRLYNLKKRIVVKELAKVPNWAGEMATNDSHKYYEVHDTKWLQWVLDNTATGVPSDRQSFYAIYDKKDNPIGFFMTKVRTITNKTESFVKGNVVEWATKNSSVLNEADINILSLETFDSSVSRVWTISENKTTEKLLKRFSFKRRGWLAMSIKDKKGQFPDIGDVSQWRIRYGCCNTILVE